MHQFSLYGQVRKDEHRRTLMQLAGVTRMQPQGIEEIHLVFKARPPIGLNSLPSAGGSQGVQQQDVQRVKTMLNASLYFVQLVGRRSNDDSKSHLRIADSKDEDSALYDHASAFQWHLEFKDTPDAGKQMVSSRMIAKIPLQEGDPIAFLQQFGYEYVTRYMILASEFYDDYTTIALRQVLELPPVGSIAEVGDFSILKDRSKLRLYDLGGGYEVHASVDVVDGNHPELKDRATKQLLALKETFKQAIHLTPGDRLALDTKVPVAPRRL